MLAPSIISNRERLRARGKRQRRGIALVFVLVFVIAMAALAMSSIFMASSSNLLAKSYDRERDLKFAAEAALAMGKSRVNTDPLVLSMPAETLYRKIYDSTKVYRADNSEVPGLFVRVYVGQTGSTTGEAGRFASIVAEARDQRGNGFIRRLELTQESFAKFAYWSNDESNGNTTIFFNNNDELWGPVWSNDTIHIGSGRAIFHDEVGTAKIIAGSNYGTFSKGKKERQKPIVLPSTAVLNNLQTYAGTYAFTTRYAGSTNVDNVLDRIEFVALDLNGNGSVLETNEGFFRVYQANTGREAALRGDWPNKYSTNNPPAASAVERCGDWHWMPGQATEKKFYPAIVHNTSWFKNSMDVGLQEHGTTAGTGSTEARGLANAHSAATLDEIMRQPNARCYLAGDPHLVSVDRPTASYPTADIQRGGDDTTFTPIGNFGRWIPYATAANGVAVSPLVSAVRSGVEKQYLWPIDRSLNPSVRGVIYASGNIGVSGTLRGRVTLYSRGSIIFLDDVRYTSDPVKGVCLDILGLVADKDIVIADNALNMPIITEPSNNNYVYRNADESKDLTINAVMMSLGTSFRVQNYDQGPTNVNDCEGTNNGRGCIYLAGGIIQQARGAVGNAGGAGYSKRYSYDRCAAVQPPPYFPTTGRFQDNRYLELDPAGFKPYDYFNTLR
jgi:hypothetical protein